MKYTIYSGKIKIFSIVFLVYIVFLIIFLNFVSNPLAKIISIFLGLIFLLLPIGYLFRSTKIKIENGRLAVSYVSQIGIPDDNQIIYHYKSGAVGCFANILLSNIKGIRVVGKEENYFPVYSSYGKAGLSPETSEMNITNKEEIRKRVFIFGMKNKPVVEITLKNIKLKEMYIISGGGNSNGPVHIKREDTAEQTNFKLFVPVRNTEEFVQAIKSNQ